MREALLGKDNPADVINVALEALAAGGLWTARLQHPR